MKGDVRWIAEKDLILPSGDGQLSEEERAAARADMEKRRAEREAQQGGAPDA